MNDEPSRDAAQMGDDPTEVSRWRPVFRLLSDMDDEIARVYADNGIDDLKPSWVLEIVRLHARGPMTIAELARSVGRTHSALSQKVAGMRAAGWLETTTGPDARSKQVTLTPKAERVAALLAAEWRATEAAITELEAEAPYPLSRVVEDIRNALSRKSFHARITEHLASDEAHIRDH
jgi:DNA-binding MarR family transcriptional regulator